MHREKASTKSKSSKPTEKKSRSSFLERIGSEADSDDVGFSIMLYGKEGVGKTSFAAFAPNPLFIVDSQEHGIHRLKKSRQVPSGIAVGPDIETWDGLLAALYEVQTSDHSFETVVIDSLTGMQRLCFKACCDAEWQGDFTKEGFFAFNNGPKTAAQKYWPDFLQALTDLQQQNINVILIGHSVIKPFQNPEGADYDRIIPDLDKAVDSITKRWAGSVLYLKHNVDLSKVGQKMKASGGEQRILCTEYDAAYDAKNSYGFPPLMEPFNSPKEGWDMFWSLLKKSTSDERPTKSKSRK